MGIEDVGEKNIIGYTKIWNGTPSIGVLHLKSTYSTPRNGNGHDLILR